MGIETRKILKYVSIALASVIVCVYLISAFTLICGLSYDITLFDIQPYSDLVEKKFIVIPKVISLIIIISIIVILIFYILNIPKWTLILVPIMQILACALIYYYLTLVSPKSGEKYREEFISRFYNLSDIDDWMMRAGCFSVENCTGKIDESIHKRFVEWGSWLRKWTIIFSTFFLALSGTIPYLYFVFYKHKDTEEN